MRISERQLRSFIREVLEDKSSVTPENSQNHVLVETLVGDWWEKTKKSVKRKIDKVFNKEKFIKDLYEQHLAAYLKPLSNTSKVHKSAMDYIESVKSKSGNDISFIVMSFAGIVPEKIYVDQPENVPELFGEVLTDITQMCGNADVRLKSMLLYKNTRQWEESFWNDTPRLKSLKSEFSPELQRDLAGMAASFIKTFLKQTPVLFMVADEGKDYNDRVAAWKNVTSEEANLMGFWSSDLRLIVMNCVTYSTKDDKNLLETTIEHEAIHAKTDYMDWASGILLKLYEKNFEVETDVVNKGSHEGYVRDFLTLTKKGWAASCLGVPASGDYSLASDCLNRMKEMLSREFSGTSDREVIANFDALVRMTTDQKPGEGFRLPNLNNEFLTVLMDSPDVALVIRENPFLGQIFKKRLRGDYEYSLDNYGYALNLGSRGKQGEKFNFLSLEPKFSESTSLLDKSDVEYARDRSWDLGNDHHVYNALMFLQMLAYSAFNKGYDFMSWAYENFQIEGNTLRGKGKGAAEIMIEAIRSNKFREIDDEDRRRVCLLIFAVMLNREGDLPGELFNMMLTMADAKGVIKQDPDEEDVRTA